MTVQFQRPSILTKVDEHSKNGRSVESDGPVIKKTTKVKEPGRSKDQKWTAVYYKSDDRPL